MTEKEELNIPKEAKPFHHQAGDKAVFFIHGFTDSLCRVNTIAKTLAEKGVTTKGVLLPGHAQTCEELAKTSPEDWYHEVKKGLLELSKEVKEIYVIGISFGGNLALRLAAEYPEIVKGVVCVETPMSIKFQKLTKLAIPLAQFFGMKNWRKKFLLKSKHPEKEIIFKQGVLREMPLVNIAQVIDFMENKMGFLNKVICDLLVIQSEKSNLVTADSAEKIIESVSSKKTEIFRFENVYHAFLSEKSKMKIFEKATDFFGLKTN